MLYTGLVSVYSENHMKHTWGNVNVCVHRATTVLVRANPSQQAMLMYTANITQPATQTVTTQSAIKQKNCSALLER
jgi:hypothetical protein